MKLQLRDRRDRRMNHIPLGVGHRRTALEGFVVPKPRLFALVIHVAGLARAVLEPDFVGVDVLVGRVHGQAHHHAALVEGEQLSGGLGLGESAKFLKKQQSMFWRFFLPGGYSPDRIIEGLAPHIGKPDNHIENFHVFTFNDLGPTERWRQKSLQKLT